MDCWQSGAISFMFLLEFLTIFQNPYDLSRFLTHL